MPKPGHSTTGAVDRLSSTERRLQAPAPAGPTVISHVPGTVQTPAPAPAKPAQPQPATPTKRHRRR